MKTPSTRRALLSSGLAAAALLSQKTPVRAGTTLLAEACILLPEQDLGPYYLADELVRSDIREGKSGVPLDLRLLVLDVRTCRPLVGAAVDIWHCDAAGTYSGLAARLAKHTVFCVVSRSPAKMASRISAPFFPAAIPAAPITSTSRSVLRARAMERPIAAAMSSTQARCSFPKRSQPD